MAYTLRFFPLQNAVCFMNPTYLVSVLFTYYVQSALKLKNNSGAKRLRTNVAVPLFTLYAFRTWKGNPLPLLLP